MGGPPIVLGKTSDDYEAVLKAVAAKDTVGMDNLLADGRALGMKDGTTAKLIDQDQGKIQVRFVDGDHKHEAAWTAMEFLK